MQAVHGRGVYLLCLVGQCCAWTRPGVLSHLFLCHNIIGIWSSSGNVFPLFFHMVSVHF